MALAENPGDVGPWNKASHLHRWRCHGSYSCSSENTTMKTLLSPNESLWKDRN
jgi:hypothetical protein